MEDAGRIRRGYFVAGLGGAQFALPAAVDMLRSFRDEPDVPRTVVVAATDPANPYGSLVAWPHGDEVDAPEASAARGATRSAGSLVVLADGRAAGYLRRRGHELLLTPPADEPRRSQIVRAVARALLDLAAQGRSGQRGLALETINGIAASSHPLAPLFVQEGFTSSATGLLARPAPGTGARS
jgi:ATP-dependent Lhr-like helicase